MTQRDWQSHLTDEERAALARLVDDKSAEARVKRTRIQNRATKRAWYSDEGAITRKLARIRKQVEAGLK